MKELSKTKASIYASLGNVKMRRKHGLFSVEGEKSVIDTLDDFDVEAVICLDDHPLESAVFKGKENLILTVRPETMRKLSNLSTPPTMIAIYKIPQSSETPVSVIKKDLYLMLDGVQDPGNLGTIIRTCHWFGIKKIFASHDTVDVYNPKTIQSTMGSLAKVEIEYCDLADVIESNRELPVYGMMLEGKNIYKADLKRYGFIIMGNEGKGISAEIRNKLTHPLLIPPGSEDHSESLNVAIATAITLSRFESLKY